MKSQTQLKHVALFSFLMFVYVSLPLVVRALITSDTALYALLSTLVFFLVIFLMYGTVLAFRHWEGKSAIAEPWFYLDDNTPSQLVIGALAGGSAALLVVIIALLLGGDTRPLTEISFELVLNEIIITIPVAGVEEFCYRGYLLSRMDSLWGKSTAIVGSSLIFSVLHFGWWLPLGIVPIHLIFLFTWNIFLGGVVLSFGYYLTERRLWLPVAFHFVWNVIAYVMFPPYPTESVILPEIFQIEWGLTTTLGFLFSLSLIYLLQPLTKRKFRPA